MATPRLTSASSVESSSLKSALRGHVRNGMPIQSYGHGTRLSLDRLVEKKESALLGRFTTPCFQSFVRSQCEWGEIRKPSRRRAGKGLGSQIRDWGN